jgi:hypothetical protein
MDNVKTLKQIKDEIPAPAFHPEIRRWTQLTAWMGKKIIIIDASYKKDMNVDYHDGVGKHVAPGALLVIAELGKEDIKDTRIVTDKNGNKSTQEYKSEWYICAFHGFAVLNDIKKLISHNGFPCLVMVAQKDTKNGRTETVIISPPEDL